MADKQVSYPTTVPLPPLSRAAEVAELLVGAIDLHCHSGPAAMPRILDHHEELLDAAAAKFRAVLYKDHFYAGMRARDPAGEAVPRNQRKTVLGHRAEQCVRRHQPARRRPRDQARRQDRLDADAVGREPYRGDGEGKLDLSKDRAEDARSDPAFARSTPTASSRTTPRRSSTSLPRRTSSWPAVTCRPANCISCSTRRRGAASRR